MSRTPTANGSSTSTLTANGFGGCTIVIGGGGCPTIALPVSLPNGAVGQLHRNSMAASPADNYSYTVSTEAFNQGHNLHVLIGTAAMNYIIPVFPPGY